jgi:transposase InsO family protein
MASKVTAMDVRMAAAVAAGVDNVARFCRQRQVSRQTFYKWRARYAADGIEGLAERSRRPASHPTATTAEAEDAIVAMRKRLTGDGHDNGPDSIRWRLIDDAVLPPELVPSRATIARVLTRRGLVSPAPRKRPRSSLRRFTFPRPNECWQADWTGWVLADGTSAAITGQLDDHSRYVPSLRAGPGDADAALVWAGMLAGITECGLPAMVLSDNGMVYSMARRGGQAAFEVNLHALGVATITATPYHPQTCGKIERFWQTLKRWLRARPAPATMSELQTLLDEFRDYYNHRRRHRGIARRTPAEVFTATAKARPTDRPLPSPTAVTSVRVDTAGNANLAGKAVNVGRARTGHPLTAIRDGDHVILLAGTTLIRALTLTGTSRYQPSGNKPGPPPPAT